MGERERGGCASKGPETFMYVLMQYKISHHMIQLYIILYIYLYLS